MARRQEIPYIPSYAGLLRFREENAKIIIKPQDLYLLILLFAGIIFVLHLLVY